MSVVSPWARLVSSRLAAYGAAVHVVDFQPRGVAGGYLDARDPAQSQRIAEFRTQVSTVKCIETPRTLAARLPYAATQLRAFATRCRADVVMTLGGGSNAAIAYLSGKRPYVVYTVGSDVLKAGWPQRQAAKVTLSRAAKVVSNGKNLAARTATLSPKASVEALYEGIDLKVFDLPAKPIQAPRFVCARPFQAIYDNDTIVRAFASLRSLPADSDLTFLSFGPLLNQSIRLADDLLESSNRHRVRFAGWVSDVGMRDALHAGSCYVSASHSDGTSSSLLEAMACGLFPIVSDIPANREWIEHGKNGLMFAPGDHVALAACMERAIAERAWLSESRITNRRLIDEAADVDVNMRALAGMLTDLGGRRRSR
jgi:L-malate glycosyltransferase